jgi:hypothetical protein
MEYKALSNEQIRQIVDVEQVFESWRESQHEFEHGYGGTYKGKMKWRPRNGTQYLYRIRDGIERSLGARSPETEQIQADYVRARNRLRERARSQHKRLLKMAPVNRALRLHRVPQIAADVLIKLDEEDLLGKHLVVVGTNALFAYEMRAGVQLSSDALATEDFDFLYDARRTLRLLSKDVKRDGLIGILKQVDDSFSRSKHKYRAANKNGYMVDLIRPEARDEIIASPSDRLGNIDTDLIASPIFGLHWLINTPRFEQMVIAQDGMPLLIRTVDPRVYALHKIWIAKNAPMRGFKGRRDRVQARIVAELAENQMGLRFDDKALAALPKNLLAGIEDIRASSA